MDITQLRYFVEVARYGSTQEAADALFVSRQSISRGILLLEKEINHDLFIRSKEGMVLSEAGKAYYLNAQKIVDNFDSLNQQMISNDQKTIIRICLPETMQLHYQDKLEQFTLENKNCELKIYTRKDALAHEMLASKKVDMIISWNNSKDEHLNAVLITPYNPYVALSKNHPLAHKEFLSDKDMADQTIIYYLDGYDRENYPTKFLRSTDYTINDMMMIYSWVHANKGIFPVPNISIPIFVKDIVFIPFISQFQIEFGTYAIMNEELKNNVIKQQCCNDLIRILKGAE